MAGIIQTTFDTTTNKDLLKRGSLRTIFDNTVRKANTRSAGMFNMISTKDEYERDQRMAGLDEAQEIGEGQNIPVQTPVLGGSKTYTQRQFGTGFRMTFRMDFFNQYSLWSRWAKDLAKVMTESKDVELAVLWNNPTSTSLTCGTGFDSLALANDAHTGLKPGTTDDNYDNYLNSGLAYSSLESARYYFETLIDDMGMWMGAVPDTLYYQPTLHFTVRELLGSEGKPHEFSNTKSALDSMSIKGYEYHRLTSTTAWGLLAKGDENFDVNCFTAMEPRMFTKDAPDNTQDRICTSLQFFTYGWGDPRCVYVGKA